MATFGFTFINHDRKGSSYLNSQGQLCLHQKAGHTNRLLAGEFAERQAGVQRPARHSAIWISQRRSEADVCMSRMQSQRSWAKLFGSDRGGRGQRLSLRSKSSIVKEKPFLQLDARCTDAAAMVRLWEPGSSSPRRLEIDSLTLLE